MREEVEAAIAWALTKFTPIYWNEVNKWEKNGRHPGARPWWSKNDIRDMCQYPQIYPWRPLFKALHEKLGLIYKFRFHHRFHGFSFAAGPEDRARMVRYAAAQQYGRAKRMAWLLEAGIAPGAFQPLDRNSLDKQSVKLYAKHQITLDKIRDSIRELDDKLLTAEVLALLDGKGE